MTSGGLLIYMSTLQPGTGGSSILAGSEVGFTTADADRTDLPALPIFVGPTITYRHGLLKSDATTSQTADLSRGKGFLAPAFDGNFDILDADGLIAVDIANGHVNPIGWDIWIGYIPANGSLYDIIKLSQLQSVDLKVAAGAIQVVAKSPAYLGNEPLYGIRTATQLDTDPVDVTNPTDPTYLKTSIVSQFGGMAFGDSPVSLKAGNPIPVETLAYYQQTALQQGDISVLTNDVAYEVGIAGINFNNRDPHLNFPAYVPQYNVSAVTGIPQMGASIVFWCRSNGTGGSGDITESNRLLAEINTFIAAGYSIILSDGNWFLDLSSYTPWNGNVQVFDNTVGSNYVASAGATFGSVNVPNGSGYQNMAGVWFNLQDVNGVLQCPPAGVDGTQVKIYAVPKAITLAAGQYLFQGFAKNGVTIPINGSPSFDGNNLILYPACADSSNIVTCSPIKNPQLSFNPVIPGGVSHVGGVLYNTGLGGAAPSVSGNTSLIVTDPDTGWNGGTVPVNWTLTMVGSSGSTDYAQLRLQIGLEEYTADFLCVESTFSALFTAAASGNCGGTVQPPFDPSLAHAFSATLLSVTAANKAQRNRQIPLWKNVQTSLADLNAHPGPATTFSAAGNTLQIVFDLMEVFIWAFNKFSFSSIYATVYPFWTRASCAVLATDGAGNVLAGGQGTSPIAADGSQNWTPLTLPNLGQNGINYPGAIKVTGDAHIPAGVAGAGSIAAMFHVGTITPIGGSPTAVQWGNAGIFGPTPWYLQPIAGATGTPTRMRQLGTGFVVTFSDGSIVAVTWTFSLGWQWGSPVATGLSVCYDVAFDGTNYIVFGPAGHVAKSANLTSWTLVTASAITDLVYGAAWLASGAGGAVYIAVGAGGMAYWASQANALAGTWTLVTLDAAGSSIDAVAVTTSGSNAIVTGQTTTGFKIWSTGDGASYGLMFHDADDSMGGFQGYGSSVVYTPNGWMVGTHEGNIITSTYGGQPAGSTWIPWGTLTPNQALANLRGRYFGGTRRNIYNGNLQTWNPVQWTGGKYYINLQSWAIAFDPPTDTTNDYSGTNADAAARKIAEEWWAFSGEMPAMTLDGSNDNVEQNFPELALGNIEDVATIITVQHNLFGGQYLSSAYIQNVNVAYPSGKPDAFFFAGWDSTGNTKGLALWTFCRNVFLKTGILRSISLTYDSVQDADTLGVLWTTVDPDLGERIRWLCDRPRYLKQVIFGNDSAAARAQCGTRYKPNTAMLDGRQMPALNSTGYGIIVQADHNYTQGTHTLDIAFPPA